MTKAKHFDVQGVPVTLTRKRVKNINLRISRSSGDVLVSAPYSVPEAYIFGFVLSKIGWIKERYNSAQERINLEQHRFENGEQHAYLGASYPLDLGLCSRPKVDLIDGTIQLHCQANSTTELRGKYLESWYRSELQSILNDVVHTWASRLNVDVNEYRIKKMKTKWGTCNITDRRIWLNLELIKYPYECIEYVVLHELTHLFERHHNARFYSIMSEHMPNWQHWDNFLDQVSR